MSTSVRRKRLQEALRAQGVDGLAVTDLLNVRYLSGFTGSNGAMLVATDGDPVLVTDGRYRDQIAAQAPDVDAVIDRDLLAQLGSRTSGRWAFESHAITVDAFGRLKAASPATTWTSAHRAVEALREVKDDAEVQALRTACAISTQALERILAGPLMGRSERSIARSLENAMFEHGAEAIAFDTIVASGPNSAIPHHQPTDRVIESGDLLKIDFGARFDGYHADCTRTVVVGQASDWQREIYSAVADAQQAGVQCLIEGEAVATSDRVVRSHLAERGWLDAFTTGLGHGVGLAIHEDPFIAGSHTGKLIRRTVLTMEPGIYLPGRGGVRIEDTVLVTTGAPEVLTTMTKDLLEIG
jgi:Xaa-Pro aminopeptidase